MNSIYLKFAVVAAFLAGGWYIKHLIEENAMLTLTVEAERAAMVNFATVVTDDINGYTVAMDVLMTSYQGANNEKEKLAAKLAKHDIGELAKTHPGMVVKRINIGTRELFAAIESASRNTRDTGTSAATKATADTH